VDALPLQNMIHKDLICFVMNNIVYRFGIP
jgi:hypothetical protein